VASIFDDVVHGKGLAEIAKELNRGIRAPKGKSWGEIGMHIILTTKCMPVPLSRDEIVNEDRNMFELRMPALLLSTGKPSTRCRNNSTHTGQTTS